MSIEIGKLGELEKQDVIFTKDAIRRMLVTLEMVDHQIGTPNIKRQYFSKQSYISVPVQGVFYSQYKAGDLVTSGTVLGYIKDVFGNTLKEIIANDTGIILYKIGTPPVNVGETLFCIASES